MPFWYHERMPGRHPRVAQDDDVIVGFFEQPVSFADQVAERAIHLIW
jgi:hypothetical protein